MILLIRCFRTHAGLSATSAIATEIITLSDDGDDHSDKQYDVPIGKLLAGKVSTKPAAPTPAAESAPVSPVSPTKLPAKPAPVKEASQAAVEKASPSTAMQSGAAADLPVLPTDQVTTKPAESTQLAAPEMPAKQDAADAAAAKFDPAQAAAEHEQQAADKDSVPVTTAEAGQVIITEAEKEHSEATKLSGQAAAEHTGPVTTEHAAAHTGKVTTEREILARARERVAVAEQLAARKAAAKLAAEAKAAEKAKAAEEAKAKAAAEAAEAKGKEEEAEAKAAVEAKAKAAEEAKAKAAAQAAKVDELNATIRDLSSQFDDAALARQTREQDLTESKRLLHELSGSLESARENSCIKAAAAALSRQKHAETIEEHAAAVEEARTLSDEFDRHFPNFDAFSLSQTIDDRKAELDAAAGEEAELDAAAGEEAELDAAAGEEAKLLKEEIAILEATLDDGNALHSMLTSKKADVRVKLERVAAALASEEQDKAAETQAREHEQLLAREHASLQALVDEGSTNLKAALDAETALTSKLNEARLVFETKVAELNALNDASKVAELNAAPRVVPVGTPMCIQDEDDVACYDDEPEAELQSLPLPQGPSVSSASSLLNTIDTAGHKDVFSAFCLQMRNMRPTRNEFADALGALLGPDVRLAFDQALDNKVDAGRRTAEGGRSLVVFCNGVNDKHSIYEKFAVRVPKADLDLDAALAMKDHLNAVFTVLGQSDFLPLVMPARTQGKFFVVIFSRDNGPNAFDAVDAEQLHEFIHHVRVGLAKCKRTNLVFSDLTWKNICWSFWLITNIDLDESAFSRALGAEQSFLAAFSMLFTSKPALFDNVLEALLVSEISQRLRAPPRALDPTGSSVHGPLAAPLANSIRVPFRLALTDAVDDHTLQKFIQRSVFFLFTHMSNFINTSGYPFSRSAFWVFTRTIPKKKPPFAQVHQGRWRSNPPQPQEDPHRPRPAFQVLEQTSRRERQAYCGRPRLHPIPLAPRIRPHEVRRHLVREIREARPRRSEALVPRRHMVPRGSRQAGRYQPAQVQRAECRHRPVLRLLRSPHGREGRQKPAQCSLVVAKLKTQNSPLETPFAQEPVVY